MVLSQQRGFRFSLSDEDGKAFNPFRIAASSAAIALHIVALLVLIAPVTAPPAAIEAEERIRPEFWPREKQPIPDPPPPVVVPVTPQQTIAPVISQQHSVAVADVPIVSEEGSEAYVPPVDAGPATSANIEPVSFAAVRLEYIEAPAPTYPREAQRAGRQGIVMLQVTVGVDGLPIDVTVAQSSGHRDLDVAARAQVLKRWRFRPAMKDGLAIQAIGMVPVNFTLNR